MEYSRRSPLAVALSGAPMRRCPNPLANRAMWIWELASTDHGNLTEILAQAKAAGIRT